MGEPPDLYSQSHCSASIVMTQSSEAGDEATPRSWKVAIERAFCLPMMLVANFVIALYFRAVYVSMIKRSRKCDVRTLLLHASALLSVANLVTFANQSSRALRHMNDISEACIVLAFSSQISIITSDASKLCNLHSLRYFRHTAEAFCALAIAVVALSIASILDEQAQVLQTVVEWHESLALVFIVSFRFYYISLSRNSLTTLLRQQPLESLLQLLLVTHAYPFIIAKHCTRTALDFYQELYLRMLVRGCAWTTTRERRSGDSRSR